jgi:hypothetical protein
MQHILTLALFITAIVSSAAQKPGVKYEKFSVPPAKKSNAQPILIQTPGTVTSIAIKIDSSDSFDDLYVLTCHANNYDTIKVVPSVHSTAQSADSLQASELIIFPTAVNNFCFLPGSLKHNYYIYYIYSGDFSPPHKTGNIKKKSCRVRNRN